MIVQKLGDIEKSKCEENTDEKKRKSKVLFEKCGHNGA